MDLVKCRHCYGYVAPNAKTCLNCGTANPVAAGGEGALAIAGLLALLLGVPAAIGVVVLVLWGAPPKEGGLRSLDDVVTMFAERVGRIREIMSSPATPKWNPGFSWSSALPRTQCDRFVTAEDRVECLIEDDRNRSSEDPYAAKRTEAEWRALAKADPCAGFSIPINELECRDARGLATDDAAAAPQEEPKADVQAPPQPQSPPRAAEPARSPGREHSALPLSKPEPPRQTPDEAIKLVNLREWSWAYNRRTPNQSVMLTGRIDNDSERDIVRFTLSCEYRTQDSVEINRADRSFEWTIRAGDSVALEAIDMGRPDALMRRVACGVTGITVE